MEPVQFSGYSGSLPDAYTNSTNSPAYSFNGSGAAMGETGDTAAKAAANKAAQARVNNSLLGKRFNSLSQRLSTNPSTSRIMGAAKDTWNFANTKLSQTDIAKAGMKKAGVEVYFKDVTGFAKTVATKGEGNFVSKFVANGLARTPFFVPLVVFATKLNNIKKGFENGYKDGGIVGSVKEGLKVTAKSLTETAGATGGVVAGAAAGAAIVGSIGMLAGAAITLPLIGIPVTAIGIGALIGGAILGIKGEELGNKIGIKIFGKSKLEENGENSENAVQDSKSANIFETGNAV